MGATSEDAPLVSVVIPTRRSASTLKTTLDSVAHQTYHPIEVIVADNGSDDGTVALARHHGCRVITGRFTERSAQLNAALAAASGEYVYRIDGDFRLAPALVAEAVEACESKGLDGVLVHNASDPGRSRWAKARWLEREMYRDDDLNVAARFVRTDLLRRLGGFDEDLVAGEDYDVHRRLIQSGARIGRITSREIHIGEPRSLRDVWSKHFYYGRTLLPYLRKHGRFAIRQLGPVRPAMGRHWRQLLRSPTLTAVLFVYLAVKYSAGLAGLVTEAVAPRRPSTSSRRSDRRPAVATARSHSLEAVVVNWNSGEELAQSLGPLLRDLSPEHIHVIDNASTDESIEAVPEGVNVVRLSHNEGFGPAINSALPRIESDLMLILNPDARVQPDAVTEMVRCFDDPTVAAVQPLLLLPDGRLDSAGSFLTWTGFLAHPGHGEPVRPKPMAGPVDIFAAKGAAFMVRTSDLRGVRGFDPSFFLYFEDTDLCWRLWLRGRRVVLCPAAKVLHRSGHSVRQRPSAEIEYHSFRNRLATLLKNLSASRLLVVLPLHVGASLGTALAHLVGGRPSHAQAIVAALLANARGFPRVMRARRVVRSQRRIPDRLLFRLSYSNGVYLGPGWRFVRSYLRRW